ncbi:hypothetical protein PIB30_048299 [Stylosanthes scabra]|uniref:Uncharacterized protein n=1 Tax=Stylosanthes scabra TaxID=79078 RepID=A0ABU6VFI9_9FABA|nr:hypothetical protein [Stylosanthes scabra]
MLELRRESVLMPPPPAILPYVQDIGFEVPLVMRDFDIDSPLLSAFVERWTTHRRRAIWRVRSRFPAVVWEIDVADGGRLVRRKATVKRRGKNEYATVKLTWLRACVHQTSAEGPSAVCQMLHSDDDWMLVIPRQV